MKSYDELLDSVTQETIPDRISELGEISPVEFGEMIRAKCRRDFASASRLLLNLPDVKLFDLIAYFAGTILSSVGELPLPSRELAASLLRKVADSAEAGSPAEREIPSEDDPPRPREDRPSDPPSRQRSSPGLRIDGSAADPVVLDRLKEHVDRKIASLLEEAEGSGAGCPVLGIVLLGTEEGFYIQGAISGALAHRLPPVEDLMGGIKMLVAHYASRMTTVVGDAS